MDIGPITPLSSSNPSGLDPAQIATEPPQYWAGLLEQYFGTSTPIAKDLQTVYNDFNTAQATRTLVPYIIAKYYHESGQPTSGNLFAAYHAFQYLETYNMPPFTPPIDTSTTQGYYQSFTENMDNLSTFFKLLGVSQSPSQGSPTNINPDLPLSASDDFSTFYNVYQDSKNLISPGPPSTPYNDSVADQQQFVRDSYRDYTNGTLGNFHPSALMQTFFSTIDGGN